MKLNVHMTHRQLTLARTAATALAEDMERIAGRATTVAEVKAFNESAAEYRRLQEHLDEQEEVAAPSDLPVGWKLVPRTPTHRQCLKGNGYLPAGVNSDVVYSAMVEEAPDPGDDHD